MFIHSSMWLRSVARVSRSSVPHHAPSRSWREEGKKEASMGLRKLHESIWHLADQACTWMQNCWCLLLLWRGHGKILFLSGAELCLHIALVITCTAGMLSTFQPSVQHNSHHPPVVLGKVLFCFTRCPHRGMLTLLGGHPRDEAAPWPCSFLTPCMLGSPRLPPNH